MVNWNSEFISWNQRNKQKKKKRQLGRQSAIWPNAPSPPTCPRGPATPTAATRPCTVSTWQMGPACQSPYGRADSAGGALMSSLYPSPWSDRGMAQRNLRFLAWAHAKPPPPPPRTRLKTYATSVPRRGQHPTHLAMPELERKSPSSLCCRRRRVVVVALHHNPSALALDLWRLSGCSSRHVGVRRGILAPRTSLGASEFLAGAWIHRVSAVHAWFGVFALPPSVRLLL
jgi:hypothetical protein